jgi:hypothetical protein
MNVVARVLTLNVGLIVCSLFAAQVSEADTVLWGSSSEGTNPGSIFRIDATTGAATLVGPNGFPNKVSDVAVDPQTGVLFGILGSACTGARLVTIDQDSGLATLVGIIKGKNFDGTDASGGGTNSGSGCPGGSDALTFGLDGTLYAGGWNGGTSGGKLLTVDKESGAVLGNKATHNGAHIAGLATAPDGTIWVSRGNNTAGKIHTIDPANGQFTSTIALSDRNAVVSDLAFDDDGKLFGSMPNSGKLVTIKTSGSYAGKISTVGYFGNNEKISGLTLLGIEVDAASCAEPDGCELDGQTLQLPEGFVPPQNATITQKRLRFTDPRVSSGRCGKDPLVLFGDDPNVPDLIIPEYLCGSGPDSEFVVLITDSDLFFESGSLIVTNEPGEFFANPLSCDTPIPSGADPQQQDVMVWQTTDSSQLAEGHALELTFECGSSRGRTKGLSYFVVGMHIDFGKDWNVKPHAVRQAFIDLTNTKLHGLTSAILDARSVLPRKDFNKMVVTIGLARLAFAFRWYEVASQKIEILIKLHDQSHYAPNDPDNNSGNVEMRAYNAKFMIDAKIIDLMN